MPSLVRDHGQPNTAQPNEKDGSELVQVPEASLLRTGRQLLYHPDDCASLASLACLVRAQIEAFVATAKDCDSVTVRGGYRVTTDVGRVGIRCVHCARASKEKKQKAKTHPAQWQELHHRDGRAAVSYPKSVRLVYQSVRNWQRYHLLACPNMPPEVKAEYVSLKAKRKKVRSRCDASRYWEERCRQMGMVDAEDGIRMQGAGAAVDSGVFGSDGGGCYQVAPLGIGVPAPSGAESPTAAAVVSPVINEAQFIMEAQGKGFDTSSGQSTPNDQHTASAPAATLSTLSAAMSSSNDSCCQEVAVPFHLVHMDGEESSLSGALLDTETISPSVCAPLHDFHSDQKDESVATLNGIHPNPERSGATTAGSVHASACSPSPSSVSASPGALLPRAAVLERVELAHSIVRTIGEIRELPPGIGTEKTHPSSSEGGLARREEMHYLGSELYKLFSDGRTLDLAEDDDGEQSGRDSADTDGSMRPRQRKKGRGTERLQNQLVPLADLGIPPALCSLLSMLMDSTGGSTDDGHDVYTNIEEVEEDLRLMAAEPDRYLFPSFSAIGGLGPYQEMDFSNVPYGRSAEVAKLLDAYEKTVSPVESDRRSQMVLLSGYSGTGKSSIVERARGCMVERGACFISGKFDAMRQVQPVSAILSALNEYCDLLARDVDRIELVRESVTAAVKGQGRVLANLVPNLRKIIGMVEDKAFAQVSGPNALRQLMFLFRTLLRVTCSCNNSVVLFLDDLHWADEVSLELMHVLVADTQVRGLLFVGCYRDNEVSQDHPFMVHLRNMMCSSSVTVIRIDVPDLDKDSVNALVSGALHLMPRTTRSLAEVVMHKTGGNALFVVQFLVSLRDSGLLRYSLSSQRWEWDIDSIRERKIADNVVELMTSKFVGLSPEVYEGLRVAAAFGHQCQKDILHILDKDPRRLGRTAAALDVAVAEGFMSEVDRKSAYRFSHDQIQNAAYQLTKSSERAAFHLQIGRSLWRNSSAEEMESYAFVIVDQLHRGSGLISDHKEKVNLAQLYLVAGQKASAMSAFLPASVYFKAGAGLITDEDWEHHRDLCFELYNSCAEMEYVLGDFESVQIHLECVLQRATALAENLRAYYTLVNSMGSQGKTTDAINTSIAVLGHLGECMSVDVDETILMQELNTTQKLLKANRRDESKVDLLHMKTMEDFEKTQAMRFLNLISLYVWVENRRALLSLVICKMVRLSVAHGVCRESATAFGSYGMMLCGLMSDYAGGYRFGQLALSVLSRLEAKEILPKVYNFVYGLINGWTEPLQASVEPLSIAVDVGLAVGDTEAAMLSAHVHTSTAFWSGHQLGPLMEKLAVYSKQMVEYNQQMVNTMNKPLRQAVLNLLGRSANPIELVGEEMDESTEDGRHPIVGSMIYLYRMWLEYMFGEHQLAAETAEMNVNLEKHHRARFAFVCNHVFYSGLNALALARRDGRSKHTGAIDKAFAKMKLWVNSTPWNCQHKLELLNAEHAYLEGDFMGAANAYDRAVTLAAEHRFIQEQALALERAGIFRLESGDHAIANRFFVEARDCYSKWGAHSKADHVQEVYL